MCRRFCCLLPALALLSAAAIAQEPLPAPRVESRVSAVAPLDPSEPYRKPTLSGRALAAEGRTLALGAGRYSFAAGTLWEVVSSEKPIGWYFNGSGTLEWKTDDPAAAQVYARNAKHVGALDVAEGNALRYAFKEGTFLLSRALQPSWPAPEVRPVPPAPQLAEQLRRIGQYRAPSAEPSLAVADLAGSRFAMVSLGSPGEVIHVFDDATDDEESLARADRPSGLPIGFPDWRFTSTIARQPIGRDRRTPPRVDFRVTAVDVELKEGEEPWGLFKVRETFQIDRPLVALPLTLNEDSIKNGKVRKTRIAGITDDAGTPLGYATGGGLLVVFLPKAATPGQSLTLRFEYEAPYLERAGNDNVWELEIASGWYPQHPSVTNGSAHTFHAVVKTRKPFVAIASGETVRRAEEGEFNVVETRLERPTPFATVIAGKYSLVESTEDGVTARVASYGMAKEASSRKLLALFHSLRKFYVWLLGPFPWKEHTIVEINTYGFGQAPPGMMRITREAFESNSFQDTTSALFSQGINHRFAHEIAHSYFGYVVDGASRTDQWISEAFSEAASGFAIERHKGKGDARQLVNVWRGSAKESSKMAPIPLANDLARKITLSGDDIGLDRANRIYNKGAAILQALREKVGDDAFYTVLRSFLRNFEKKRVVTTGDFIALASFVTKEDLKPWFEKVYYGFEIP